MPGATMAQNNATDQAQNSSLALNESNVTTSWNNLTFMFKDRESARSEYDRLKLVPESMNGTYRPKFENLTGRVLLSYIKDQENFSKSLDVMWSYVSGMNSLNVNDKFFETFLSDAQNLSTEYNKAISFGDVKLKSLSRAEWDRLFAEEPGLEMYRAYLEANYIRYADHRPRNETHAILIADLQNQRMKLETEALKKVTNNVTNVGNITLDDGTQYQVDSGSYSRLMSTDTNRNNRKKCYDARFYHMVNESDKMATLYSQKAKLDDRLARELNFTDAYQSKMYDDYMTADQVAVMNTVFKDRKADFDRYFEFRKARLGLDPLMPYDLDLQLMKNPDKNYSYAEALKDVQKSYSKMDPAFNQIFIKTVTSGSIDVYPNPDHGKQPGGYCQYLSALKRPALIFLNYNGLLDDLTTLTHEMGHAINSYLMANSVDYLYCGGTMYEAEVASTFDEELFVDYAIENYDRDTATALLAQHISDYNNLFTRQTQITEFERQAHEQCQKNGNISGAEMNALWTKLWKEYRTDKVEFYPEDWADWTRISHIYFTNNYYTYSYSLSQAIVLSLFKKYKDDPVEFNKDYIAYLSAGTTMTPPQKLRKYFGIEMNRQLFEDAMDMVKLRVDQLEELEEKS
ncbi:MAG TPA: M3 family oligoendopeptidase [Methanotrichaceae archaeon]|nr:M3 family oligoendopeptidase [Methanotrichaceae archaeon]